jgi:hypothetical protein
MLFWALLASGQITLRKVDGWQTLPTPLAEPIAEPVDRALPEQILCPHRRAPLTQFPHDPGRDGRLFQLASGKGGLP